MSAKRTVRVGGVVWKKDAKNRCPVWTSGDDLGIWYDFVPRQWFVLTKKLLPGFRRRDQAMLAEAKKRDAEPSK